MLPRSLFEQMQVYQHWLNLDKPHTREIQEPGLYGHDSTWLADAYRIQKAAARYLIKLTKFTQANDSPRSSLQMPTAALVFFTLFWPSASVIRVLLFPSVRHKALRWHAHASRRLNLSNKPHATLAAKTRFFLVWAFLLFLVCLGFPLGCLPKQVAERE